MVKKINLTLISILCIISYFSIPYYRNWAEDKFFAEGQGIEEQYPMLGLQQRMTYRFGKTYLMYLEIARMIRSTKDKNALLLMPRDSQLKEGKVRDFLSCEPAVFYYFTGLKSVFANSPAAKDVNWVVTIEHNQPNLRRITTPELRKQLLDTYLKYK